MTEGISIIVLTKDRPDLFRRCAESVAVSAAPIVDRIVIQNGTDGETAGVAEMYGWTLLSEGRNLSFAAGNNLAARTARGSHLFLLNNDAECEPDTLAALWAVRERQLVGCLIIQPDGTVNHAGMGFVAPHMVVHIGRSTAPEAWPGDIGCHCVTFAGVLIARELWDRLGGLDEVYWYSYEDVDFCLRARELGVESTVAVAARLRHAEHGTRTGGEDRPNAKRFQQRWPIERLTAALHAAPPPRRLTA